MNGGIYLDHSATTPIDPRAVEAMAPWLKEHFGNPSSLHAAGREARSAVDAAREQVASLLGASSDEIVFTASGTEANNLALRGIFESPGACAGHLIVSAFEHPSIMETCRYLEWRGAAVTYLKPNSRGSVEPATLAEALRPDTRLVSIMSANNVVGTLQPLDELGALARSSGALFHTDAVQAVGKIPFDMGRQPIDMLTLGAHKFHGPKGVGALFIRRGVRLTPLVYGGGQERGLRSATENVAGIVGMGAAAVLAEKERSSDTARLVALRERIIETVQSKIPGAYLIGDRYRRLPGHVCLGFSGLEADSIRVLLALDNEGVFISSGSACSSGHSDKPSYVLQAMGFDAIRARGSLRITMGRFTTEEEIDRLLTLLPEVVDGLKPTMARAVEGRINQ
jgi:cysteine desulfurase